MVERRRADPRQESERRQQHIPGRSVDVTRQEFENLYGHIQELLRLLRRVEAELQRVQQRIDRIEAALPSPKP